MKPIPGLLLATSLATFAADPSLEPHPDPTGQAKYAERSRILVDLDGDEKDDLLLSGGPESFGTMGGPWTVYLRRDGDYREVGEVWAHPKAIAFEPDHARISSDPESHRFARIWVYLRSSGREGSFGYYRVGKESVDEKKAIEIYPGDGGTDLGRALYQAAFDKSPIPFRLERSTTAEDGTVTWSKPKR